MRFLRPPASVLVAVLITVAFPGCASAQSALREGDSVRISFYGGHRVEGVLINRSADSLYLVSDAAIRAFAARQIRSLSVQVPASKGAKAIEGGVAGFFGVLAAGTAGMLISCGLNAGGYCGVGAAILTVYSMPIGIAAGAAVGAASNKRWKWIRTPVPAEILPRLEPCDSCPGLPS